ncbi:zinc finger CCHC domain-containing protein 7-like isoform X1 [Xenia sp. Carnegie-2017]|uniref:zinc finger CCHC domain-containing protein 7-like isoform X1 n=1 Tax=Xenia sp. Carnegie-2017 TaxID=2897299 RepID=UPI001F038BC1|nr:zinc finger CCHC domain-containing protein 7-like isoform X1 [Xenia sp. Carnegie-2017]XP_046859275.1 zinc finger CCHC domain-containing protein 7-like isoform X1 [Xenia sp. Carnegie-2017]
MNDFEDCRDVEFQRAFEDELYKDTFSLGSDENIDSDVEAELYQNVHFASSLVEKNNDEDIKEVEFIFTNDNQKNEHANKLCFDVPDLLNAKERNNVKTKYSSNSEEWKILDIDLIPFRTKKHTYVRFFNWNKKTHRTLEVTQSKKEIVCWLCGETGHHVKACNKDVCYNCRKPGHKIKKCPRPRRNGHSTCNRCHAFGHFEDFCPDRWRQYHYTIAQGEMVRASGNPLKHNNIFCYNCGEEGHLGHECIEGKKGFTDSSYPYVVKYDQFTSKFVSRNVNRNSNEIEMQLKNTPIRKSKTNKKFVLERNDETKHSPQRNKSKFIETIMIVDDDEDASNKMNACNDRDFGLLNGRNNKKRKRNDLVTFAEDELLFANKKKGAKKMCKSNTETHHENLTETHSFVAKSLSSSEKAEIKRRIKNDAIKGKIVVVTEESEKKLRRRTKAKKRKDKHKVYVNFNGFL